MYYVPWTQVDRCLGSSIFVLEFVSKSGNLKNFISPVYDLLSRIVVLALKPLTYTMFFELNSRYFQAIALLYFPDLMGLIFNVLFVPTLCYQFLLTFAWDTLIWSPVGLMLECWVRVTFSTIGNCLQPTGKFWPFQFCYHLESLGRRAVRAVDMREIGVYIILLTVVGMYFKQFPSTGTFFTDYSNPCSTYFCLFVQSVSFVKFVDGKAKWRFKHVWGPSS